MLNLTDKIQVAFSGTVTPDNRANPRVPYEHQRNAMKCLDILDKEDNYSTLVVLPTGGGKTYTASTWLLKNAIDQHKKILWIAHRQMLLDQAAESFQKFAYVETVPHVSSFAFRIVSGSPKHDRTINIKRKDNLLIISKDSLGRNLACLDNWLKDEKEIYMVIDEAHHSTAKTYRKVIDYVKQRVANFKLIGLTATPFRTAANEQGLLSKIYYDGVEDGCAVHNENGIAYAIGLKDLISKRILAKPIFESHLTEEDYGKNLGVEAWSNIQHLDTLPDELATEIADSAARNKLIVETYKKNMAKYGQTIVFAVNVNHAITLSALFNKRGIKADFVVSDIKDMTTGINRSREDNEKILELYRKGELQVLVNVNILTEGVDLPQTKAVFLARPTVSTTLMTQMIGRALRGERAGGTNEAYIVSFVDRWNEHIAWVNPESIFVEQGNEFHDNDSKERFKQNVRLIAIAKIEEFAKLLDGALDTTKLEAVPFEKRIPLGMYLFTYMDKGDVDVSCQVMVYDSTREAYADLMKALPALFKSFDAEREEYLTDKQLKQMEAQCHATYFLGEMIPAYEAEDVINVLKYFAQYDSAPNFYPFEDVDRSKVDVSIIAKHIWQEDMGARKQAEYLENIWNEGDENILRLFFSRKSYFIRNVSIELEKLAHGIGSDSGGTVDWDWTRIEDMSLEEIRKVAPDLEKQLRDAAFAKALGKDGRYHCAICGFADETRIPFQVDHIVPMNKGGKTRPENLQILCRRCNGKKSDK